MNSKEQNAEIDSDCSKIVWFACTYIQPAVLRLHSNADLCLLLPWAISSPDFFIGTYSSSVRCLNFKVIFIVVARDVM